MGVMGFPLISAAELHERIGEVTVLDVRYRMGGAGRAREYERGHIPRASYVDLDADLRPRRVPAAGTRCPRRRTSRRRCARSGVRNDRPVVVYDDWSGLAAGRAWWLLRHHGHTDVRVLDGAWAGWLAAGGAVHTGTVLPGRGDFTARPGAMPVVEADDVLGVPVLVDARAPERYRGETEPVDPVAGHIPGAVNVPTSTNLAADGRFRSAAELRALYAAAGVDGARTWRSTAVRASRLRTTCWRWRSPGSGPRSTRAAGRGGSRTRRDRSRRAEAQPRSPPPNMISSQLGTDARPRLLGRASGGPRARPGLGLLGGGVGGLLAQLGLLGDDLLVGGRLGVEEGLDRLLGDQVDGVVAQRSRPGRRPAAASSSASTELRRRSRAACRSSGGRGAASAVGTASPTSQRASSLSRVT